jgi:protein gp37
VAETSIQWTDAVWNPVRGCSIVSPGCTNCYAMKQAHRFSGPDAPYEGLTKLSRGGPVWTGKVRLVPELLDTPLRWKKPRRVFVNSMSDLFHEYVPDAFIDRVFAAIALSPQHTFQILTKRPERMLRYMTEDNFGRWGFIDGRARQMYSERTGKQFPTGKVLLGPLPHVWLGVSVEDQERADERIPLLLQTPAAVRFVSYEPALWLVDFTKVRRGRHDIDALRGQSRDGYGVQQEARLDWIIVGGESGPGARPFDVRWARDIVRQCKAAGVAAFVKQLGSHVAWDGHQNAEEHWPDFEVPRHEDTGRGYWRVYLRDRKGGDPSEWPEDLRVRDYPS